MQVLLQMQPFVFVHQTTDWDSGFPFPQALSSQVTLLPSPLSPFSEAFEALIQTLRFHTPSYSETAHNFERQTQFHAWMPERHSFFFHRYKCPRNSAIPILQSCEEVSSFRFQTVLTVQPAFLFPHQNLHDPKPRSLHIFYRYFSFPRTLFYLLWLPCDFFLNLRSTMFLAKRMTNAITTSRDDTAKAAVIDVSVPDI